MVHISLKILVPVVLFLFLARYAKTFKTWVSPKVIELWRFADSLKREQLKPSSQMDAMDH